jgi:hypothetical protein
MFPSAPRRLRLLIALTMATSVITLSAPVSAAPRGVKATFTVTSLIDTVSASQSGAFDVFARNDGNGTWTHAILVGTLSAGTVSAAPAGCSFGGAAISCDLDKLDAGASATRRVIVQAPGSAGSVTLAAVLTVDAGGNNKNAASRDTFTANGAIGVRNDADFFGRWQGAHASGLSFGTAGVGGSNLQSTKVDVPPVGTDYPAIVSEVDAPIVCSGSPVAGFGKTVDLSIANGQTVSPYLTVTMTYDRDATDGRTPGSVSVVHQRNDGTCEFPPRDCDTHEGFCFDARWEGHGANKKLVIEMQLPTNGRGRGA